MNTSKVFVNAPKCKNINAKYVRVKWISASMRVLQTQNIHEEIFHTQYT